LLKAVDTGGRQGVIEFVKADPGFERALAAALGDDLDASLDSDATRRWSGSNSSPADPPLPAGCEPLAAYVRAPSALQRRLEQIGLVERDDGRIVLAVGQRLVTRDGTLRRWDGYVATESGAGAADRLIRINRLAEIEQALPDAVDAVRNAEVKVEEALGAMREAQQAAEAARRAETEAVQEIREAAREEDAASVAAERLELRRAGLAERMTQVQADLADASQAEQAAVAAVGALPDSAASETRVAALRLDAEARKCPLLPCR